MKFLIVFVLALAAASASTFNFRPRELYHRELTAPVIETDGRITNGRTASAGQFPYQVGLSLKVSTLSSAWCGGSLIGTNWVLTAAHCTDGIKSVSVILGVTDRNSKDAVKRDGKEIHIHSGWNSKTLKNDISLIKIDSVSLTSHIQLVKLPANNNGNYVGDSVIASGWGRTSDSSSSVATYLEYADMTVSADSKCSSVFGTSTFTSTNVCVATVNHVSTCNGDSGGPLVLSSDKVQIGLTSYGAAAGCEKGYPVVFTRVPAYRDWIKSISGV